MATYVANINGIELTQDNIDYVLELFNAGNDPRQIAEHTGRSFWTVAGILRQFANYQSTI
jgi:hypothetical protein